MIFLTVLKITGFVLLGILGLVLLLLLLVLFVPVRYNIRLFRDEERLLAEAKVTWLSSLISFVGKYEKKDFSKKLRILFFTIFSDGDYKKVKRGEVRDENEQGSHGESETETVSDENRTETEETPHSADQEAVQKVHTGTGGDAGSNESQERKTEGKTEEEKIPEKRDAENEEGVHEDKDGTPEDEPDPLNSENGAEKDKRRRHRKEHRKNEKTDSGNGELTVAQRIKNIYNNKDLFERAWEKKKDVIIKAFTRVKKLIVHVLPRKTKGDITFGFKDPANTGQVLGLAAIMYSRRGAQLLRLHPDFENEVFLADAYLSGRVVAAVVLVLAAKVYFNKELRRTFKYFKHLTEVDAEEEKAKKASEKTSKQ